MDSNTTRQLLETYYEGFARKEGWESVIADDFRFTGGSMTQAEPIIGKHAYIEIIARFSRVFESMEARDMIVEGGRACVTGNYQFRFPNGERINGNVAELWTVKDGKLQSLSIFFDTLTFDRNTPK
ncbi:nuclear transport factor 2 family protein [Taibaiella koreensis]|uniref:nuclear transport factor 2 family protein n=1 Tax=Taibaiella koreensis TaxID=1268548 RepID=UPI000E59E3D2|nr:nuclear transport factor 2 family protein [Taibaiella koreensis]